ncbi:MAG: carboxypeptidase regulatory-like domain-containing protein [Bacteroidales bacterium]|nr:carboxypeptidase regulatory-like domain-containing protein [Candidatus Liminaster caballi]
MNRALLKYLPLLVSLLSASCTKDIIDTSGNLVGVVSDSRTGAFLPGVSVSLNPSGKSYTTGADGKYEFRDIETQEYSVSVSKSGYKSDKRTAFVQAGQDTNLDFQLTPNTGVLSISQNSLDFGNETSTLIFDVINVGSAPLNWQITEDVTWISCNPTSGTTQDGEKSSVVVTVNRNGLERGNYAQTIAVSSDGGSSVIIVNMAVQGLAVSLSPEELDFGSITTSMELNLTNTGSGSISYTITPSNDWIKLSRTTGTFTKTENITVSVNRGSLSEGNHSGYLTLVVGEERLTIPVRMNIPSKEKPTVSLQIIDDVTFNSAHFKGGIVTIGSAKVTKYGFCWSMMEDPTTGSFGVCNLGDSERAIDFTYTATSLEPNTTYYVRAYAENEEGVSYSNQMKFQTKGTPQLAGVTTGEVSNIQATQAQVSGNVLNLGNTESLSQYGHVWSTMPNPTTSDYKTQHGTTSNTGSYTSTLTGLSPSTTYYVRAYVTNSVGTAYGEQITFRTGSVVSIDKDGYGNDSNWNR